MPNYRFYNRKGDCCVTEADPFRPETWPYKREEIHQVWSECTDMFLQRRPSGTGLRDLEQLRELLNYIALHYREKITLQSCLKRMGMSKSRFCVFFKQQTEMSLIAYINKVRIEQAAKLLFETNLSCESVAYDCGFTSPSQFYSLFKEHYHQSPAGYKKR